MVLVQGDGDLVGQAGLGAGGVDDEEALGELDAEQRDLRADLAAFAPGAAVEVVLAVEAAEPGVPRFAECQLELRPEKTTIVYCKDDDRRLGYSCTSFDLLGYTFRPRRSKNRRGKYFINFSRAISNRAAKAIRREIRRWKLPLRSDKNLEDLARMFRRLDPANECLPYPWGSAPISSIHRFAMRAY